MGNNSRKRHKGILIIDSKKDDDRIKPKKGRSLFDNAGYDFDSPAELNAFEKMYMGLHSDYDSTNPEDEYIDAANASRKKQSSHKRKSFLDDDDNEEYFYSHDQTVDFSPPTAPLQVSSLITKGAVTPTNANDRDDEDDVKDRALCLAEDFAKRENVILVGGVPCVYNGKFYELLRDDEAQRRIFRLYRKEVGQGSAVSVLKNAVSLLKLCASRTCDEFPPNSDIIVFENGTLEVATGRFRRNSPNDMASSALGICYEPEQKKMPWTKYFLETIADGDDDLYELMLQVIGYVLSNDIKAKSFFYLEGVGDAGKSRFCDLIASFFPASGANKVARIALQDLGGKFALGNLVNAKLNISEDLPDNPLSATTVSRIKMISDANRLEAEAKYVQPFSFRPSCKLLFASNHPLRLKEHDAAFVNRVVYIPFLNPIPKDKQDKDILSKMQGELPALFNHAFKAYRRLVANGYNWAGADRFKPQISTPNSGIVIDKTLILKRFVTDCCELDEEATTATADLQEAYNQFCREHSYPSIQGDRFSRELSAVLPSAVARVKIGNQRRGFRGIGLKTPAGMLAFDDTGDDF